MLLITVQYSKSWRLTASQNKILNCSVACTRLFLIIGNSFGQTAILYLIRGFFQGAPSSPTTFILTFDPCHKIIRASGRGCYIPALNTTTGSSPFADDSNLHTDGPYAIPAMRILVTSVGAFVRWLGLFVNMPKSYISAIDFSTGQSVAADRITLDGLAFTALLSKRISTSVCE